jgi:hypothetical protein
MSVQQGDYIEGVGTAGTSVGGVVSVQGVVNGTSLPVAIVSSPQLSVSAQIPNLVAFHIWTVTNLGVGTVGTGVLTNSNYRGIFVGGRITAQTGTPSLNLSIVAISPDSVSQGITFVAAPTGLNGVGAHAEMIVYPGITPITNVAANNILTPHFALIANNTGAGSTVSVDFYADFLP